MTTTTTATTTYHGASQGCRRTCGHAHRSIEATVRCIDQHSARRCSKCRTVGCRAPGRTHEPYWCYSGDWYSGGRVVRNDGAPLTEDEVDRVYGARCV